MYQTWGNCGNDGGYSDRVGWNGKGGKEQLMLLNSRLRVSLRRKPGHVLFVS